LYASKDGNTKTMAGFVGDGASSIPKTEVRVLSIHEAGVDDLIWCDGIALGSPTNIGTISWEMKRWWDETVVSLWPKVDGKLGCAFSSSGALAGGGELTCLTLLTVLMNYGFLVFGVTDYVGAGQTLHYGAVCAGTPRTEADQEACRRLGRRLAEWVHTLVCNRPESAPAHAVHRKG
jgi:NAD(P)H dehydrogenase (quinone)